MSSVPSGDVMVGWLHPNEVSASFQKSLMGMVGWDMAHDRRMQGWSSVKCATGGLPEGRNKLMQAFLDSDAKWLFMVDADMGFEPMALDLLLSVGDPIHRPIVGGLCFAQREASDDGMHGFRCVPRPTIFDYVKHEDGVSRFTGRAHYPVNSLVRCAATGTAFLLIHRTVAEKVKAKYGTHWFTRITDADGAVIGEDISFFVRTNALEIPCHVHTGIRTTHLKHLWVQEQDFWWSFLAPPATERVDVLVPVLHRPQNVAPLMESLTASTGLATAWFICEPDDEVEQAEVLKHGGRVLEFPGTFAQKVNHGFTQTVEPWVMLCGDDVRFRAGWLDQAQDVARRYEAMVVGTNDAANPRVVRGEHATHPLIRRTYVERVGASWDGPGIVCHEGYRHWFVDDEIVTAAKQRRVFQAAMASQVEHFHPMVGKAPQDDIYALGASEAEQDRKLFEARLRANAK